MRVVTFPALCSLSFSLSGCASEQGDQAKQKHSKDFSEAELIGCNRYAPDDGGVDYLDKWLPSFMEC